MSSQWAADLCSLVFLTKYGLDMPGICFIQCYTIHVLLFEWLVIKMQFVVFTGGMFLKIHESQNITKVKYITKVTLV